MLLCGLSVLGSHSRGAMIGIAGMLVFFWLKSRHKVMIALALVVLAPPAIEFMPGTWGERMKSIVTYETDSSAMGRINSWTMAINLAADRPLVGGGFDMYNRQVFERYAPDPQSVRSAHSIYFQMLGEHGYVGLTLFLLLWALVWRDAAWIKRRTRGKEHLRWASDLAGMIQVGLVGYGLGAGFLQLAYYDVPYYFMVVMVLTRKIVEKELKPQHALPTQSGHAIPAFGARDAGRVGTN
jgi:probable O-glycosylation ligase (exosortase A-associated)